MRCSRSSTLGSVEDIALQKRRRHRGITADRQAAGLHARAAATRPSCGSTAARTARTITPSSSRATVRQLERQFFATHGYVVLAVNYRGGTGRGAQYARAILADWGHKEVEDLLAGVDYADRRAASPIRSGSGSAAGAMAEFSPTTPSRAIRASRRPSAAPAAATRSRCTAADEYLVQYNAELGPPWRDPALWLKVSYPFFHADRIHTPDTVPGRG